MGIPVTGVSRYSSTFNDERAVRASARCTSDYVTTFAFAIAVLGTLGGLYVWAKRRAQVIRRLAAEREQAALAMMLAGKGGDPQVDEPLVRPAGMTPPLGAAPRLAAESTDAGSERATLPPLDYQQRTERAPTPAEQAAADLDPIEDLISQIMVDDPAPRLKPQAEAPRPSPAPAVAPSGPNGTARKSEIATNVPLRELALAWYESRGYRGSPASPAVWPIELVLRHREDAARAYAFVVQSDHVSVDRITALIDQAREIGMMRVAVIAEAGYERGAKEIARKRNVRLIDRRTMEAELAELQLATAAKIIAVARGRSSAEPSPV